VPIDKYPTYNFIGRIFGPGGNSLKNIENITKTKISIRGQGSQPKSSKDLSFESQPKRFL
ncbi:Hypothetical protein KVN_LOCUS90, partial [uncultured virus]